MNETSHPRFWTRLHDVIHKHKTATFIIVGVGLFVASGLLTVLAFYRKPVPEPSRVSVAPKKEIPKPPPTYYSPLSGIKVKDSATTNLPSTAIMIENSPDARPQSGLKEAEVVYEAIAEGGITRFLTIYQQNKPKLIGPVRSLRMYFVDWLAPYNASVAHVGGSAASLQEVRNGKYRDIDQFFYPATYWRSTDRYAPHNVYTNFSRLDALNKQKGYKTSKIKGLERSDDKNTSATPASSIEINFSSSLFNTRYTYDKKNNHYQRYMGDVKHVDREKGNITPKVIVALNVNEKKVFEDGYREQITTTGSGNAKIFQNGKVIGVTWHKKDRNSNLTFTNKSGKNIPLARGQTWIAAVPNSGGSVSWK